MKTTPDKYRDQAAATAAAKLLSSAKKSMTRQCTQSLKLSLQKTSNTAAQSKSSARTLAFSPHCNLNDTMEFEDSVSMKSIPKLRLATRKRKRPVLQNDQDKKVKTLRHETHKKKSDISNHHHERMPKQNTDGNLDADKKYTAVASSAQKAVGSDLHQSLQSEPSVTVSARLCLKDKVEEGESETDSQCEEDLSMPLHTCPACGKMLRHGRFVRHMQMCLKQHCEDEVQTDVEKLKDKTLDHNSDVKHPSRLEQTSCVTDDTESLSDFVFCQLCQKDLSHLNSHHRMLHINKCIDEEEKKRKEVEERQQALEAARTQVLDCPMCGKVLRTAPSRKSHLKKCASNLGVEPEQLLAAVKRQEEEHLAALAAGVLPSRYGHNIHQNSTRSRRGPSALPKSKLDEDTQLALALSSSLQPDSDEAGPSASRPSRRGRKTKQEEDYLLVTLSQSQAAERIETRVSDLIMMEADDEEDAVPALPRLSQVWLHDQIVQWSSDEASEQSKMFWRLSSLEDQSGERRGSSGDRLQYYVPTLMPPVEISTVVLGSKFRRMSEIPGRRHSQEAPAATDVGYPDKQVQQSDESEDGNLPPFSTQTAALLADMAAEADGIDDQSTHLSSSLMEASVNDDVEQQVHQDLLSAFSSLVNQEDYSDVIIRTAGGTSLYAHQVILSVRCPAFLQQLDRASGTIDLCEWSPQCVLAVFRFLYAGEIYMDKDCLPGTLQLAQRFGLISLAKICKTQLESLSPPNLIIGTEENEQLSQSASSERIFADCFPKSQNDIAENNDRKGTSTSGMYADQREQEPPILEHCPLTVSPTDTELRQDVSPKKHSVCDANQSVQCQLEPMVRITQVERNSQKVLQCEKEKLHEGSQMVAPQEKVQTKERSSVNFRKQVYDAPDRDISSILPLTDTAGYFVSKNVEKKQTNAVSEMFGMMVQDRKAATKTSSARNNAHHPESDPVSVISENSQSPTCALSENVELGSPKLLKESENLVMSVHPHTGIQRKRKAEETGDLMWSVQTNVIAPSQSSEPIDSIEISDDDLFSSGELDVSVIPSTPKHCQVSASGSTMQNFKEKDKSLSQTEGCFGTSEDIKKSPSVCLGSDSVQKMCVEREEKLSGKSPDGDSCERTKTQNTSSLMLDPPTVENRWHSPAFENSLSSVSVSAIEYSYQHSSLHSPKQGHFQTFTPELPSEKMEVQKNFKKVGLLDKRDLSQLCISKSYDALDVSTKSKFENAKSETTFFQNRDATSVSVTRETGLENDSVCGLGNKRSPCISVVEQDFLYVTPVVEQSNIRKTFQLVTPLPQQQEVGSSPRMPVSPRTAKKSMLVQNVTNSDGNITGLDKRKQLHKKTDGTDLQEHHHGQEEQSSHCTPQPKAKENEESFMIDSDSDLEIIATNLQDAPSPKFNTQSRLSSSQSQTQSTCKTIQLSPPEERSESSPKEASPLKKGQSPRRAKFQPQQFECRTECSHSFRPGPSPVKISPSSSLSGFSQRSAESDKELLRVTELMCSEAEEKQPPAHPGANGTGDARPSCHSDRFDAGSMEEDVWEGFNNLDDHNPDLHLGILETNADFEPVSHSVNCDRRKTPPPHPSPKSVMKTTSKSPPDQVLASPFKTPTKSPKKSKETSAKKSPVKAHISAESRRATQSVGSKASTELETPVKFRSSTSDMGLSSRATRDKFKARSCDGKKGIQLDDQLSSGFLIGEEDSEAANSSFLWSEENAPTEDSAPGEEEGTFRQAALDLGREEPVLTQDSEILVVQTPKLRKQSKEGGKSRKIPPSPFTPMPPYDDMITPDLKNEVQKYGLKPVGKKRMKLVLKDIYHKTHQYETDSDCEEDSSHLPSLGLQILSREAEQDGQGFRTKQPPILRLQSSRPNPRPASQAEHCSGLHKPLKLGQSGQSRKASVLAAKSVQRQTVAEEPPVLHKEADLSKPGKRPKTKRGLAQKAKEPSRAQSTKKGHPPSQETEPRNQEFPARPFYQSPSKSTHGYVGKQKRGHVESPIKSARDYSSSPEKGHSSSQESDASERPDVSVFEEGRLDSDDNEEITPSQQLASKDLPQKLMAFFQGHPELYSKVLTYEPLDLGVLKEDLNAAGIKCAQDKLLDFLDEKCITFTTKNMIPRKKQNRGRKPQSRKDAAPQKKQLT